MATLETVPNALTTYSNQRSYGVIGGKSQVEIAPKYGGDPFKSGDIIRLEIPSQAFLNPDEFYIQMRCRILPGASNNFDPVLEAATRAMPYVRDFNAQFPTGNAGGTSYKHVRFTPGIQSCFDRIKVLAGSTVIEDIQDYNVLYRLMLEATSTPDWRQGDGFTNEGFYDPADPTQTLRTINRHTAKHGGKANDGHYYTFRPFLGILNAGKALPLKYMGQLTLELYLAPNQDCLWSSTSNMTTNAEVVGNRSAAGVPDLLATTSASEHFALATKTTTDFPNAYYEIDRVRMQVPFIHPIESYDKSLMDQIENNGLDIHFTTFSSSTRQIANSEGRLVISFQERAMFLKGGLAVMRNSPSIRNIASDFCFPANGIESYQWKIGSEYIPAQEIDCKEGPGMALNQLMKSLGCFGTMDSGHNIRADDFLPVDLPGERETQNQSELARECSQPSKFAMGLDLDKSQGQISGFDSAAASVDVELILRLRTHKEACPILGNTAKFQGGRVSTFQPTKVKVITDHNLTGSHIENAGGQISNDSVPTNDAVKTRVHGKRGGLMTNLDLTIPAAVVTAGAAYSALLVPAELDNIVMTPSATSNYARVNFFAHIDAILRIRRVGQLEIIR